jgi:hypothetical protein
MPQTKSPRPREYSISVAAGKKEAMRKGRMAAVAAVATAVVVVMVVALLFMCEDVCGCGEV